MAQDRVNFINYRRRSYSDSGNLLSSCYATALQNADASLKPVLRLQNEYQNVAVEVSSWRNNNLLRANFTRYDTSLNPIGFVYPGKTQLINLSVPSASFTNASVSGNSILKDSRYQDEASFMFNNGNPVTVTGRDGIVNSYLWDYSNTQPIAKVSGAANDQIAYTSFEADGMGGWSGINTGFIQSTGGITGSKYYNQSSFSISKSGLVTSSSYIVSYWSRNGAYSVSGTQSGYPKTLTTISFNGNTWTLYEHLITGQPTITVTGSGAIDELRLYPKGALMTTYTYSPLIGISSQSDATGRISYYEYDALGRLQVIKDQNQNIVKKYEYRYASVTGN
jgi:YD repeat-containing protein